MTQPPLPVTQPVVATQPYGTAMVPFMAVPGSLEALGAFNNTKPSVVQSGGNAGAVGEASQITSLGAVLSSSTTSASITQSGTSSSTLFLTQLMGQGGKSNLQLASIFFSESLSPGDPRVFDAYSDVKYMPSFASKFAANRSEPRQPIQQAETVQQRANQAQQVAIENDTRQQQEVRVNEATVKIREAAPAVVQGQANLYFTNPPRESGAGTQTRRPNSEPKIFGNENSANAYLAAFTRSSSYATMPAPRFTFEG